MLQGGERDLKRMTKIARRPGAEEDMLSRFG